MNNSANVHHNEGTCQPLQQIYVFLLVFGQKWRVAAQRNKLYQALATHNTIPIGFDLFMEIVDVKKIYR